MSLPTRSLEERIKTRGRALGLQKIGIGPVDALARHGAYLRFLDEGKQGTMGYLARDVDLRRAPSALAPGAGRDARPSGRRAIRPVPSVGLVA